MQPSIAYPDVGIAQKTRRPPEIDFMEFGYVFFVGLILGFGISVPVGPINILCVQRTMLEGRKAGFIAGLGAAVADSIYGLIAAIGLSIVADQLKSHGPELRIVGGSVLIIMGLKSLYDGIRGKTNGKNGDGHRHWIREWASHAGNFLATFVLTLTNPVTILAFAAMFAGLGLTDHVLTPFLGAALWLGVLLGASTWWWTVVFVVSLLSKKINLTHLSIVNKVGGALMALCGVAILVWPILFPKPPTDGATSQNSGFSLVEFFTSDH